MSIHGDDTAVGILVFMGAGLFLAGSLLTSLCYGLAALALYII